MENTNHKCGFVAILGRPNVGKSTLLNYLNGYELSITSYKPQTTRDLIRLVLSDEEHQIIFLDTPGIHQSKHALDKYMAKAVSVAMQEADIFLLMIEADFKPRVEVLEERIGKYANEHGKSLFVLLNKTDAVDKEGMLPLIAAYSDAMKVDDFIPISAKTGDGVENLLEHIRRYLPEGPPVFSSEDYTNQSERDLLAELIRQQLLIQMQEEIPHGTAVHINDFKEIFDEREGNTESNTLLVEATIFCERDSQKGMIIGKGGQRIKQIRKFAEKRIRENLAKPCQLKLYVKVREDWRNKPLDVQKLGYNTAELDLD